MIPGEQTNANGLVYLRARHYDPSTGTFLSRDPVIGAIGGRSIRFNGYAYAGANPVNYVDPDGEFFWLPFLVFASVFAIDYGSQVVGNLGQGMDLGRAISSADFGGSVVRGLEWSLSFTVGYGVGAGLKALSVGGRAAFGLAALADFSWGYGWDRIVRGEGHESAFFGNVIGFGLGEVAGYGLKGLGRAFRRGINATLRGADQVGRNVDVGGSYGYGGGGPDPVDPWVSSQGVRPAPGTRTMTREQYRLQQRGLRLSQPRTVSRVYRVQGGTPPKASRERIRIGPKGEMRVTSPHQMLHVTFDDYNRSLQYIRENRPGAYIISFEVENEFVQQVRRSAIPQNIAGRYPGRPQIDDARLTPGSFGLPSEWIQGLITAAQPGTGLIIEPY